MKKRNTMGKSNVSDNTKVIGKRNVVDKRNLAFGKTNFIILAISACIVIIGFILMSGPGTTVEKYNPDIFSPMRVTVAPIICFLGFISMIVGVMYRPRLTDDEMMGVYEGEMRNETQIGESEGDTTLSKMGDRVLGLIMIIAGFCVIVFVISNINEIGQNFHRKGPVAFIFVGLALVVTGLGKLFKKKK